MGFIRYYQGTDTETYQLKHCVGQAHGTRKHSHLEYAISIVTQGSSTFRYGNEEIQIHQGQLVVIAPNVVHQCCPQESTQWGFYMVYLSKNWLEQAGYPLQEQPDFSSRDLAPEEYKTLLEQFKNLCHRVSPPEEALVAIADAAFLHPWDQAFQIPEFSPEQAVLEAVEAYLRTHLCEPVRLDALAQQFHMDKYVLIRQFSKQFNASPHAWQNILRMNEARRMLLEGYPISETATAVGFYDQSHFSKAFKESFGVTPLQIQK